MANPPSNLWMLQAQSDMICAERIFNAADHRTFCQAISKFQQAVEKAVKAVFQSVNEIGFIRIDIGYGHNVDKLLNVLSKLPNAKQSQLVQNHLNRTLNGYWRHEILELMKLAPKRPPPGQLNPRNTEYPYEVAPNKWVAPAALETFGEQDVRRFKATADTVFHGCRQLIKAISLGKP